MIVSSLQTPKQQHPLVIIKKWHIRFVWHHCFSAESRLVSSGNSSWTLLSRHLGAALADLMQSKLMRTFFRTQLCGLTEQLKVRALYMDVTQGKEWRWGFYWYTQYHRPPFMWPQGCTTFMLIKQVPAVFGRNSVRLPLLWSVVIQPGQKQM